MRCSQLGGRAGGWLKKSVGARRWQDAVAAYEGALASPRLGRGDRALAGNNLGLLYRNKQRRHDDAERVAPAPGARAPLCAVRGARGGCGAGPEDAAVPSCFGPRVALLVK